MISNRFLIFTKTEDTDYWIFVFGFCTDCIRHVRLVMQGLHLKTGYVGHLDFPLQQGGVAEHLQLQAGHLLDLGCVLACAEVRQLVRVFMQTSVYEFPPFCLVSLATAVFYLPNANANFF
jgi:hypothetical protein